MIENEGGVGSQASRSRAALLVGFGLATGVAAGVLVGRLFVASPNAIENQLVRQSAALDRLEANLAKVAAAVPARTASRQPVSVPVAQENQALGEQVSAAVHEALDTREAAVASAEEKATTPTEAQWSAYHQAETVLNRALAAKAWTDSDARELRTHLSEVTLDQRRDLLTRVAAAVNADQVRVEAERVF